MNMLHRMPGNQSPGGEPERRGDERSEAPRSGGSPSGERAVAPGPPDPEVPSRPPAIHDGVQAGERAKGAR
jgi:hypothetical protein